MRIAIIGGGIAGLATAYGLDAHHDVVLFEAADWLGGHTHTVDVPLSLSEGFNIDRDQISAAFEARYKSVFGNPLSGIPMRVLNLRVSVIGVRPNFDLHLLAPDDEGSIGAAMRGTRPVWVDGGWTEATIYERLHLPVGAEIKGPALLEQPDTTIFVEPDLAGKVDEFGNLVISRKGDD